MGVKSQHQVELSNLLFGLSWEDPSSDRRALAIKRGDIVTTISSGGCNTLTLLLDDPEKIYAIDINASQSYLLELKIAAVRHLEHEELLAFLGLAPCENRLKIFENLVGDLTSEALAYWTSKAEEVQKGVVYTGRYECFIGRFIRFLRVIQGKKRIEDFFRCGTLEEQKAYFDRVWNTISWRLLFKLAFNKRMLAKRGLTADYFKFDDGSSSFAESFFRRSRHAMCEIPISTNYFLAQYLRRSYWNSDTMPDYLRKENLPIVRGRLSRIEVVTLDAQGWFGKQAESSIDAFSLSNICELMSPDETGRLFVEIARTARKDSRICFRNLIVPRSVPERLSDQIELQEELSRALLAQDRSFVYSRVQAYVVRKKEPS